MECPECKSKELYVEGWLYGDEDSIILSLKCEECNKLVATNNIENCDWRMEE